MYPEIFLSFYFFETSFFRSLRSTSHLFLYIYFQFLNFWVTLLFSICNFLFNYLQFQPELCFMASFNWCALLCLRVFIIFRVSLYRFWAFFFFLGFTFLCHICFGFFCTINFRILLRLWRWFSWCLTSRPSPSANNNKKGFSFLFVSNTWHFFLWPYVF